MNNDNHVVLWEAPQITPPEFRLYYDQKGNVICYTCEKLEGTYLVIDALTYAQARPDVRVVDGKLMSIQDNMVIYKLVPDHLSQGNEKNGVRCAYDDISIVVNSQEYTGKTTVWTLNKYEL